MAVLLLLLLYFTNVASEQTSTEALLPPPELSVSQISKDAVRLTWSYNEGNETNVRYNIHYKHKYARAFSELSGITTTYFIIGGLDDDDYFAYYLFYVVANKDDTFVSKPSETVYIELNEPDLYTAPRNVSFQLISSSTLLVQWQEPEDSSIEVMEYMMYFTTDPNQPLHSWNSKSVSYSELTLIFNLQPNARYTITVQSITKNGFIGLPSPPITVKTQLGVPNQPTNLQADELLTGVNLTWTSPVENGEMITSYELYWNDTYINDVQHISIPTGESYVLNGLYPNSLYYIWVTAKSHLGEGPSTPVIEVSTKTFLLEAPKNVNVEFLSLTAITVTWLAISNSSISGVVSGYILYLNKYNSNGFWKETLKYDIPNMTTEEFNITGLEPMQQYDVQISGVVRKTEGFQSPELKFRLPALGAPVNITVKFQIPNIAIITWKTPVEFATVVRIKMYHVIFCYQTDPGNCTLLPVWPMWPEASLRAIFPDLNENVSYVFRVYAATHNGNGLKSSAVIFRSPQPSLPPVKWLNVIATSRTTCHVQWESLDNLNVVDYRIYYTVTKDYNVKEWMYKDVTLTNSTELVKLKPYNAYYVYVVAKLGESESQLSPKATVRMITTEVPSKFIARSLTHHTVVLNWTKPDDFTAEQYLVSYEGEKEYLDSQLILQKRKIPIQYRNVGSNANYMFITSVVPFAYYQINITAQLPDKTFGPSIYTTITTKMTNPPPMVKPEILEINETIAKISLPRASEENGPISYYLLMVLNDDSDQFNDEDGLRLLDSCVSCSYTAAKFIARSIPSTFSLGDGLTYNDFVNKRLEQSKPYRVCVRAVILIPDEELFTTSAFSDSIRLVSKS